ncbi:MAG: ComF family protein [Candidatus Omnitrophota bacterium]|nr:ComF family protein [Candidatus Omnitrophota bacterium]
MLAQIARGIGSLLFPSVCPSCRRPVESGPRDPLCAACLRTLPRCRFPGGKLRHVDGTVSPFLYKGVCRDLVLALKYQGRTSLVPFLADRMAEEVVRHLGLPPAERILPVPLHPTRLRERTFNQAELLARALADRMEIPCEGDLLIRCRPTRPQAELTRDERSRNVRGAFDLRSGAGLKGSRLLLVDDILTTGATAEACAALLKKAGARSVWVVTAARD